VAEQLDLAKCIDRACGADFSVNAPSIGEMVVAVAIQRACEPGAKKDLAEFLNGSIPRISCLPGKAFTGQAFHRLASRVSEEQLDAAQLAIAASAVRRFDLVTDMLSFDTTNFDTHIATTTPGTLARRGKAKSKRSDLRVVGLGVLVSEIGQVPLLHRVYPGNSSDQAVLTSCLTGLATLHESLTDTCSVPGERTIVRDGGFWSPQLELELHDIGYGSIISLPTSHKAAQNALAQAAKPRRMRRLKGSLSDVRAARVQGMVGDLKRTLIVVESQSLLDGQKRGIAAALTKAEKTLTTLQKRAAKGHLTLEALTTKVKAALKRERLATFVVTDIRETDGTLALSWRVDTNLRREMEQTVLGRRVLCTERHHWSTERIVAGFRGQWNVEEVFRRSKGGGLVPWGPSHQWADSSLRLHTFAAVIGLMLVALAQLASQTTEPAHTMMAELAGIRATLVRVQTTKSGRPPTYYLPTELTKNQLAAVHFFELGRWLPSLLSARVKR